MDVKSTCIIGHLDYFQKPSLEGRPNTNQKTLALRTLTTADVFYFIMCEDPREKKFIEDLVTYDFTLHSRVHDHTIWFWRCVGMAFGHLLLGSHNFMVTTLGSSVKWP